MISQKHRLVIIVFSLVLVACGGSDTSEETPLEEQPQVPAKVIGTLPENGEPCSDFEEVSGNPTKVSVKFNWNSAQFAEDYQLRVFENQIAVSEISVSTLETDIILDRGKTYTWSVTSMNADGETSGDIYSFTTPGIPIGNYAPYAADIRITFDINSLEMSVSWMGGDEDGDVLVYDVKIIQEGNVVIEEIETSSDFLEPFNYISDADYKIEVISKDPFGNSSISYTQVKAPN